MKYNYDIAILCALYNPEFKSILDLDCNWEKLDLLDDSTSDYYKGTFQKNGEEIKLVATSAHKWECQHHHLWLQN